MDSATNVKNRNEATIKVGQGQIMSQREAKIHSYRYELEGAIKNHVDGVVRSLR